MSYINDALKKAQKERDGRYERFGGIIEAGAGRPEPSRKRTGVIGAAVAILVAVPAGLLLYFNVMQPPPQVTRETSRPVAVENAAPSRPPTPRATGEKAPEKVGGATLPAESKVELSAAPGGEAPAPVPESGNRVRKEAEARYQEAVTAQRGGDLRRAGDLYREALALDPGHVKALNNLGVIYMGQKMRSKAVAAFSRAVVLKKDYVDPYYNLACLYAQANEIDESLWYLKVAVTINGDVKKWAGKDADLKNVAASPAFKNIMEGR